MPKYSGGESKGNPGSFGLFFQLGFTSPKANPVKQAYAAGMSWTGMIPKRGNDVFGFGASMERFSLEPGSGYKKPAEVDIEMFYVYIPKKWLNIQPDIQYIINPGGSGVNNALVVLLDVAISL